MRSSWIRNVRKIVCAWYFNRLLLNVTVVCFLCLVGSFYAMQFASNLLVAVASVLYSCKSSVFYSLFLLVYVGGSVVGTNIMCHRYVLLAVAAIFCFYGFSGFPFLPILQILDGESDGNVQSVSHICVCVYIWVGGVPFVTETNPN